MPRRVLASATPGRDSSHVSFADIPAADTAYSDNLLLLRRQWKWAAFSQFFYTFAQLFAAPDIVLTVSILFAFNPSSLLLIAHVGSLAGYRG
jgi:hypothetical protein